MDSNSTTQAVFEAIAAQVLQVEFKQNVHSFFEQHCEKFTNDEENKLEYTQIHEAYMEILDKIIESNLMGKFEDE